MQRGEGAQVGLLRQIVGGLPVAERHAQPPDVGLGRSDEGGRRHGVPIAASAAMPDSSSIPIFLARCHPVGNQGRSASDQCSMASCSTVREALSARLDGEPLGIERRSTST